MCENLLIIGAGQYGLVAKEIAQSTGRFERISFLDDNAEIAIGKCEDFSKFFPEYKNFFVAIGNPEVRRKWIERLLDSGFCPATLISPLAYVSETATLGKASVVEPMAVIQANSVIGDGCLVCSGAVIKHNVSVGSMCYIDCCSVVMPGSFVPDGTRVAAGSVFSEDF